MPSSIRRTSWRCARTGVALAALVALTAGGVDIWRYFESKALLQTALQSAAHAVDDAFLGGPLGGREEHAHHERAKEAFNRALAASPRNKVAGTRIELFPNEGDNSVSVRAHGRNLTFAGWLLGIDALPLEGSSERIFKLLNPRYGGETAVYLDVDDFEASKLRPHLMEFEGIARDQMDQLNHSFTLNYARFSRLSDMHHCEIADQNSCWLVEASARDVFVRDQFGIELAKHVGSSVSLTAETAHWPWPVHPNDLERSSILRRLVVLVSDGRVDREPMCRSWKSAGIDILVVALDIADDQRAALLKCVGDPGGLIDIQHIEHALDAIRLRVVPFICIGGK